MADQGLSSLRAHALFDYLSHRETYDEIERFKYPGAIRTYGPPFKIEEGTSSTSPILQTLLSKYVLTLPGLRDVSQEFWQVRVSSIVENLAASELSESYDKGGMGIRKTVTTAISAFIEYIGRGTYGGFAKEPFQKPEKTYDTSSAEDVEAAWHDFLQDMVYGSQLDDVFGKAAETDRLEDHAEILKGTHEYIVINLASILHYTLIVHPKGQPLLTLIEKVHKQIPYGLVKQTLKIGNVASMINGMMKIFLVKMSVNSWSNWAGLTQDADEGMNLLEQIIAAVLAWESKDLQKRASKMEKDKIGPSKEQLEAIKKWLNETREYHDSTRRKSQEHEKSIVAVILDEASVSQGLSERQHTQLLEYLTILLAVEDRNKIIKNLCKHNPDHLTQLVKDILKAYEPVIRAIHNAVDLSATTEDFEAFTNEMIKLAKIEENAKPKKNGSDKSAEPPSVQDFVKLLRRHQSSSHRFLHQVAKNGPEVSKWWLDYAKQVAEQFRESAASTEKGLGDTDAGSMTAFLTSMFLNLSSEDQKAVLKESDAYSTYLSRINRASSERLKSVINNTSRTDSYGPGMYLTKWQDLLDSTAVTPGRASGRVRYGKDKSVIKSTATGIEGEQTADLEAAEKMSREADEKASLKPPEMKETWRLLGPKFREMLAQQAKNW